MATSLHFLPGKLAAEKEESFEMNANETAVRNAYQVAERKDYAGWVKCFTEDGTFTDESIGVTYRGKELSRPVETYGGRISRHASGVVPVFR